MHDDVLFDAVAAPPGRWQRLGHRARALGGTLKLRLALGGLLLLWGGMALTAWHLGSAAQQDTLRQAAQHEREAAAYLAAVAARRLDTMQQALALAASGLSRARPADAAAASDFMEGQTHLHAYFANVFVARPDGVIAVYQDEGGQRQPASPIGDRAYFRQLQASGRPVTSEPVMGRVSGEPVVVMAHPVAWPGGGIGAVGGALRLASRDLLAELAERPRGEHDGLTVITDAQGRVLAHPQRDRLLQPLAQESRLAAAHALWVALPATQRPAAAHWDTGSEVVAMATDPASGWQVWRAVSHAALLAPVHRAERQALQAAAGVALGLTALLALFLHWQLRPLAQLRRSAQALRDGAGHAGMQADWPQASGEIGELVRALRHVWAERAQVEDFNRQVLDRLHSVMASAPVGLAFTRKGRFELVSAELCKILGLDEPRLVGQLTCRIFAANADYAAMGAAVQAAFAADQPYVGEWRLLHADGREFWARMRARPVDAADPAAGTIWSVNDISDQVAARVRLEHAALHDALTAVSNRKGFELQLHAVLARRQEGHASALLMIDLDRFKPVNDTHGHAAGDAVLVAVAHALTRQVRASDVVARLGGDEFALLLPACELPQALRVAEKVRRAVTTLGVSWQGQRLGVGASVGLAMLAPGHADPAAWLAAADAACYAAKRGGRNRVCASDLADADPAAPLQAGSDDAPGPGAGLRAANVVRLHAVGG